MRLPLPVTLLAVGTAIFGALLVHSVGENREDATWQEVGADYRIEPWQPDERLARATDVSGVDAVAVSAEAVVLNARLGASLAPSRSIQLLAAEIPEYQAAAAGRRADPEFPDLLLEPTSGSGIGTEQNPIPAIVSSAWPGEIVPEPGDVFTLQIGPRPVTIVAAEARESFPGLVIGRPFAVLARPSLAAALPALDVRPNRLYLRAPDSALGALESTIRSQSSRTRVISRSDLLDELAGAPLVAAVDDGYRTAVVLATLLAVFAVLAGIALTAKERFRDLGYLRTLGLSSRQVSVLTVVEQAPPALLATVAGVGFGYALVWLVRPGLDLTPFGGGTSTAQILVDWGLISLVAAGVLAAVMGAIAIYSYRTRRLNLANVLRMGDRG